MYFCLEHLIEETGNSITISGNLCPSGGIHASTTILQSSPSTTKGMKELFH